MIVQGVSLNGLNVYDSSFNGAGALLYVDAGNTASYPGTGTAWTGLSNNASNATLVGNPPWTSSGTASYFTFNGLGSNYASTTASKFNVTYTGKTVFVAARITAVIVPGSLADLATTCHLPPINGLLPRSHRPPAA